MPLGSLLLSGVIGVSPVKVDWIVKATIALHNYQRWNSTPQADSTPQVDPAVDAEASPALQDLRRLGSNNSSQEALAVREKISNYLLSAAGEGPWQNNINNIA